MLIQAKAIQIQQEVIPHQVALAQRGLSHDRHMAGADHVVIFLQAERIHIQILAQMGDRAAADSGIRHIGGLVFVDEQRMVVAALFVQAVERPDGFAAEASRIPARQRFVEQAIIAVFAAVIDGAQSRGHLAHGGVGHVQGRERGLARPACGDLLKVGAQDIFGLRREIEDHVHVERFEVRDGFGDTLHNLLAAAVFLVAVHLLEQFVIEALHAHGQALDAALHLIQIRLDKMVGIGLRRHFLDVERISCKVERLAQLVDFHGRRAAAHINALDVVA